MIITDFFKPEEQKSLESLVNAIHRRVQLKFGKMLQLDVFPTVTSNFILDTSTPTQGFGGFEYETKCEGTKVISITPTKIVLNMVGIYSFVTALGFDRLIPAEKMSVVMTEFIRHTIIYNLIKMHEMKHEFERFHGDDIRNDVFQPIIEREANCHYYHETELFYREKLTENKIGNVICEMMFPMIEHMQNLKTSAGLSRNPKVKQHIWSIVREFNGTVELV